MHLADKPEFSEDGHGAIHGDQPDAGAFPTHLLIYGSRGKMVAADGD
jgi:hypothetical protein